MTRITHVGILFVAKLQASLFGLAGLVCGIVYSVGGLLSELWGGVPLNRGTALAFLAIVGMPLLFAAVGFLVGLVGGALFNWLAPRFGGLEVDLGN